MNLSLSLISYWWCLECNSVACPYSLYSISPTGIFQACSNEVSESSPTIFSAENNLKVCTEEKSVCHVCPSLRRTPGNFPSPSPPPIIIFHLPICHYHAVPPLCCDSALFTYPLDYCKYLQPAGCSNYKSDYTTPWLKTCPHCPRPQKVQVQACSLACRTPQDLAPSHLLSFIQFLPMLYAQ